jgi:dTDP-4-amino-4,6-dideoxygalactose transaminase
MLTADSGLDEKMRSLRDHGAAVSDYARHKGHGSLLPEFNMVGYNYRMTDIQASIGIEQMKKIKHIVDRRRAIAAGYDQAFRDFPSICIPAVPGKYVHTYQSYVILLKPHVNGGGIHAMIDDVRKRRNNIMAQLAEKGITTRQGTSAVHLLGFYRNKYGYKINDYPNSAMADYASISLPIYTEMSEVEQQYVIDCVRESVSNSQ